MNANRKRTAQEKRAQNRTALAPFHLAKLAAQLPLVFPRDPQLPPSPKCAYRSRYRYPGYVQLMEPGALEALSPFEICLHLFDFSHLEVLLAARIYAPSAKGQRPFHPVSMYLLSLYRRAENLSRHETLRRLRHKRRGRSLRRLLGFGFREIPSEAGLRYFEKQIKPDLQWEINAQQIEVLYQAGLLPTRPQAACQVDLSFDGMLHEARSRLRCSSVREGCYQAAPRPCPAREKKKRGCDCTTADCAQTCRYAALRDPQARFVAYSGNNKQPWNSPNAPQDEKEKRSPRGRMVFGYYSYCGQILDADLATYWNLPAAFAPANQGDPAIFPDNFTALQARFPWLQIGAVIADAALCEQTCLDLIWEAGALRMVDICAHQSDADPTLRSRRSYNELGHPLCPCDYVLLSNGFDYQRRLAKWRCSKRCLRDPQRTPPQCPYLEPHFKHGYTTTVGRTHADGSVRLAREIPFASQAWKQRYNQRNSAESRNSILQLLGLKRLPLHGLNLAYLVVLQADFIANQRTLVRLIRQAANLL